MNIRNKFTPLHRILHWIMALAMPVLFITGFLRMFWMNKNRVISVIESKTDLIPREEMTIIAEAIREPMWQWHFIFAHVMIFSFLARIIYMIVRGIRFPNPFAEKMSLKKRLHGLTYIYFYGFVLVSAVTGIMIKKEILSEYSGQVESIHKLGLYWFPIFIILHLAGVVWAEFSDQKGITSKMIAGEVKSKRTPSGKQFE